MSLDSEFLRAASSVDFVRRRRWRRDGLEMLAGKITSSVASLIITLISTHTTRSHCVNMMHVCLDHQYVYHEQKGS